MNALSDSARIVAVNFRSSYALLGDGRIVPFVTMFDENGDRTDDSWEAFTATIKHPDGGWLVVELDQYEMVVLH